jgi:hypothetical protein
LHNSWGEGYCSFCVQVVAICVICNQLKLSLI